jgi:hypothetical protein
MKTFIECVEEIIESRHWGKPSALRRKDFRSFCYVPMLRFDMGDGRERREHLGKAGFASRDEAVAYARATIARRQATLRRQFMDVTQRALRERHGFPRELSEALAATYDDAMRALKSGRSKF